MSALEHIPLYRLQHKLQVDNWGNETHNVESATTDATADATIEAYRENWGGEEAREAESAAVEEYRLEHVVHLNVTGMDYWQSA